MPEWEAAHLGSVWPIANHMMSVHWIKGKLCKNGRTDINDLYDVLLHTQVPFGAK